ncbi:hypothetical protein K457DRAFT_691752 [Linnemannia elongata AG-77]|uniref:Uncharacterized protein n=1 Tax=Linnemannia elongata AG-77 TaxID=1314771 RepID=A0A197JMP5_9FUNG|nr:hypothetical protein K457DRAFT_691752 [Linnemannia elongata AG-77]
MPSLSYSTQICHCFELKGKNKKKRIVLIFGHILPCKNSRSTSSQQQLPSSPNTTHGSHSQTTQPASLPPLPPNQPHSFTHTSLAFEPRRPKKTLSLCGSMV